MKVGKVRSLYKTFDAITGSTPYGSNDYTENGIQLYRMSKRLMVNNSILKDIVFTSEEIIKINETHLKIGDVLINVRGDVNWAKLRWFTQD